MPYSVQAYFQKIPSLLEFDIAKKRRRERYIPLIFIRNVIEDALEYGI